MKAENVKRDKCYRLRAVLVLGLILAPLVSDSAWAQQIEPLAGTWKTWVLTSGSQLRIPPPPNDIFGVEIAELRTLESQRDAAAQDLVNFWDTSSPGFRWIEMTYALGSGAGNARPLA